MHFTKWQGLGNDFIIINADVFKSGDLSVSAAALCDRHYGVGADGLILIHKSDSADYRMQIINSGGGEAEMCGNGVRCAAKYVKKYLGGKNKISFETLAGKTETEILPDGSVKVNMGAPEVKEDLQVSAAGFKFTGTPVSMGNPHFVIFTENMAKINIMDIGSEIETLPVFPGKTNVEFVQITNRENLRMRVWERGAGVTLACGTGACAAAAAAFMKNKTHHTVTVHLDGGLLTIEWQGKGHNIYMSGPAEEVFKGEINRYGIDE